MSPVVQWNTRKGESDRGFQFFNSSPLFITLYENCFLKFLSQGYLNKVACRVKTNTNWTTSKSLVTGTGFNDEASTFLLKCFTKGKDTYEKLKKDRLHDKRIKLSWKELFIYAKRQDDVKKETINFLRIVDYSRLKMFDLQYLLSCEIVNTTFYLTQMEPCENYPRQSLQEKWRISLGNHVQQLFPSLKCLLLISWRMVGRCQLKVWFDNLWKILAIVLWQSFSLLSIGCSRMDIFFWFVRAAHY